MSGRYSLQMAGKLNVTFLGTGSTIPSPERAHPAIAVSYFGENLLFDCGEGTQVKLQQAGLNPMRISKIFITHFHPDHFLGLPGLLSSIELYGRTEPIEIYAPKGALAKLKKLIELTVGWPKFPLKLIKAKQGKQPGEIFKGASYSISSCKTVHHELSVAYSFVETDRFHLIPEKLPEKLKKNPAKYSKIPLPRPGGRIPAYFEVSRGRKITYGGDTKFCESLVRLARGADLLIHEATFPSDKPEKAEEYCHSTPETAARVAKLSGARKLVLTHFSRRISDIRAQEEASRKIFPESFCAQDLQVFEV